MDKLTVVTPIKETSDISDWYSKMRWLLDDTIWAIIDSGGGEQLKHYCSIYIKKDIPEWEARQLGYTKVTTPFTLNLDVHNILPEKYVAEAISLLESNIAEVCAIDYEESIGHYGFGTSIWNTETLREVYDYPPKALELAIQETKTHVHMYKYSICECTYIWNKLYNQKRRFVPLLYKAKNQKI